MPPFSDLPERRIYGLLLGAIAAMAMGQTLVFALLPLIGRAVGLRELQIGVIITASSAVYAVATRMWGRRSDRVGRKRVIVIGLCGYTLGTLLFTSLFWLGFRNVLAGWALWLALVTARCLQSTVMAGTMPAANAYVSDITSAATRTVGIARLGAANSTGTIVGPAVGGLLAGLSLLAPLYFAAAMTFTCTAGTAGGYPSKACSAATPFQQVTLRVGWAKTPKILVGVPPTMIAGPQWEGDCKGTAGDTCTLDMSQPRTVQINFNGGAIGTGVATGSKND